METKRVNELQRTSLERLLAGVPFYNTVKLQDRWQFETLLQHSLVVQVSGGERVLQRGTQDHWLYFLLKGQLVVQVEANNQTKIVNYITPGEVFGDLALLIEQNRTADVVADENCREVWVFGTDFRVFGDLTDFSQISLQTKLAYYRNTVHNLRWKLEVYRMKHPDHLLAGRHRQIKLYNGPKDNVEELAHLNEQAKALANMLVAWNRNLGELVTQAQEIPDPVCVESMQNR